MQIEELMTPMLVGVAPDTMLIQAVTVMHKQQNSCILITEGRLPIGIITERDLVALLVDVLDKDANTSLTVTQVMTLEPISMPRSTSLADAMMLVRSRKLRHLLVTDEAGELVGLLTQTDMLEAYLKLIEQHSELKLKNQALYQLSNEDALMHIGNRRAMEVELDFYQASAQRYKKQYAVALLDVDFFKKYNDHYGHQMGDKALQALSDAIKSSMRDTDKVFRYGGEEILLLMPETSESHAETAVERIRHAVENMQLAHQQSPFAVLTISIGLATSRADETWGQLVARADKALYQAKANGRNRLVKFKSD